MCVVIKEIKEGVKITTTKMGNKLRKLNPFRDEEEDGMSKNESVKTECKEDNKNNDKNVKNADQTQPKIQVDECEGKEVIIPGNEMSVYLYLLSFKCWGSFL